MLAFKKLRRFAMPILLLMELGLPSNANAACNIGQDAKTVTSLQLGALGLSGFSPGSLRLVAQQARVSSDVWRFSLQPPNYRTNIQLSNSGNQVSGKLILRKPITGVILEAVQKGDCRRIIQIDDDALKGATMRVTGGQVEGNVSGQFDIAGQSFKILENRSLRSNGASGEGSLRLSGRLKINRARVVVPGAGTAQVNLLSINNSEIVLFLSSLRATIVNGDFSAGTIKFAGDGELNLLELQISFASVAASKVRLRFEGGSPSLVFGGMVFEGSEIRYSSASHVKISSVSSFEIDELHSAAAINARALVFDTANANIIGASLSAGTIQIQNLASQELVSGAGQVALSRLSPRDISAKVTIEQPSPPSLNTAAFQAEIRKLTVFLSGSRSDPAIKATGSLAILQLGSLLIAGQSTLFSLTHQANGSTSVDVRIGHGDLDISRGQVVGTISNGRIKGNVSQMSDLDETVLTVPAHGFSAELQINPISIAVFGGNINSPANRLLERNDSVMEFGPEVRAQLELGQANLVLKDIQLQPEPSVASIHVQTGVSHSGPGAQLRVTLDTKASIPLLINAHFELPGFSLRFDPIPLELGSLEVDFTSLAVAKFVVDFWGATAAISMEGIEIGIKEFRPRKLKQGEVKVATDLRGSAAGPFTVERLSGFFQLLPWPPAFSELAVYDLRFSAMDVRYVGPSDLSVDTRSADIAIPHVWMPVNHYPPHQDPFVSLRFKADDSNVSWRGAPNGTAELGHINISLGGQPSHVNGSLSLSASVVALSGRANIPLGTKPDGNHGCTLTVPANVGLTMRNIAGDLDVLDGKAVGKFKVTDFNLGRIHYWGHRDCRWTQDVKIRVLPYPCEWSWGIPTKWCNEISFTVGWVFAVKAIDMHIRPANIEFQVGDDGKIEACKYSVAELIPNVTPVFSIAPQLPFGGDIAKWINDIASVAVGTMETLLTRGAIELYSVISMIDFASGGSGLNIKSECR